MKYKILLTGNNKTIIDDLFTKSSDRFEYQSTSSRYEDILSHLRHFKPDGFLYCLNHEIPESFRRMSDIKHSPEAAKTAFFTIGTRADCDAYTRTVPGVVDLVMEKPMNISAMEEKMSGYFISLLAPKVVATAPTATTAAPAADSTNAIPANNTTPAASKNATGMPAGNTMAPQGTGQPYQQPQAGNAAQTQAGNPVQAAKPTQTFAQPQTGNPAQAFAQPQTANPAQAFAQPQTGNPAQAFVQPQTANPAQAFAQPQTANPAQAFAQPQAANPAQAFAQPQAANPTQAFTQPQMPSPAQVGSPQQDNPPVPSVSQPPVENTPAPTMPNFSEDPNDALLLALTEHVDKTAKMIDAVSGLPSMDADAEDDPTRRKHILVVDDDSRMLKIIKRHLADKYDVATALNGRLALKFLETKKTDLILLDYEMPLESGPTILKKLRDNPFTHDIPVIFLTGISDRDKIEKALVLKPQGYLLKPIDHIKLLSTISKLIG